MWASLLLIVLGLWLFFQAVAGDLGGRIVSWAQS